MEEYLSLGASVPFRTEFYQGAMIDRAHYYSIHTLHRSGLTSSHLFRQLFYFIAKRINITFRKY